jgi:putative phosphoribosyl transferase
MTTPVPHLPFSDRVEAGRLLGEGLSRLEGTHPVVLGIPRGGVPIAAEVALRLDGDLDIIVARKLGAPMSPELAIGAVTADGGRFLNDDVIEMLGVNGDYVTWETARQLAEARTREVRLRAGHPPLELSGRTVILCDDGLATGATMRASARSIRKRGAGRLIIAVPVGSREACAALASEADEVVCLAEPEPFIAVGRHYVNFEAVEDDTVARLLKGAVRAP